MSDQAPWVEHPAPWEDQHTTQKQLLHETELLGVYGREAVARAREIVRLREKLKTSDDSMTTLSDDLIDRILLNLAALASGYKEELATRGETSSLVTTADDLLNEFVFGDDLDRDS